MATDLYADASALAKLVVAEPESAAVLELARERRLATSSVARVELTRVVRMRQADPGPLVALLRDLRTIAVDDTVLASAAKFADAHLRTIDAIHLASALELGATEMLVYDRRLAEAAEAVGIEVVAPR